MEAEGLLRETPGWALSPDGRVISRTFTFKNFIRAMVFANAVSDIAELEQHHPDLHISWGKVVVELSTHSIKGLSENDFIVASHINEIP
jgi:4a-hydroxytetrahydrobiopterin dehydratase